jgi:hypothetical protein
VIVDEYGRTCVNLNNMAYQGDLFILASQATQIFYVTDTLNEGYHVYMFWKRRILGVENVVDEEEYNQFDDLPTVGARIEASRNENTITNHVYMREVRADDVDR